MSYEQKDTGRFYCTNEDAIKEVIACYSSKSNRSNNGSVPYALYVEIAKKLTYTLTSIPHFDSEDILGLILISSTYYDSGTSTEFYDVQDVKFKQAPTAISAQDIMYLNN